MVASTSQRGSVSRVLLIAVALAAAGVLLWFAREDVAREPVTRDPVQVAAQAEVERQRLLQLVANQLPEAPEGPCLPLAWRDADATPEPALADRWTAIDAAGERLREDGCGAVWALWYNSWTVMLDDEPQVTARFGLRALAEWQARFGNGSFYDVANRPVHDYLFAPDKALWVMYWEGTLLRGTATGWTTPVRRVSGGSGGGRFIWYEDTLWVTQPVSGPAGLQRWDTAAEAWQGVPLPAGASFDLIAPTAAGALLGAGPEGLFERAADGRWTRLADAGGKASALAEQDGHVWLATDNGLLVVAPDGTAERLFDGENVTGVVARPGGRAWVALRNNGLRWYDGSRWHRWRYAEGLPADDATDLMLSASGRLWVGGKPLSVIDVQAAERAAPNLRTPPPLPAQRFADACTAAQMLLGGRRSSGAVAFEQVDGAAIAFFGGRQVCPNPRVGTLQQPLWVRRDGDGALLRTATNGIRGSRRCGQPCRPEALEALRATWNLSVFTPRGDDAQAGFERRTVPPPDPVPDASPGAVLLLAENGDVWAGGQGEGLWQHDGERWRLHGEEAGLAPGNRATDIRADGHGGLWYATTGPRFPVDRRIHAAGNLHHYDGSSWRHYSPQDGLGARVSSAVAVLPGATAVATNGGLSLLDGERVRNFGSAEMAGRTTVQTMSADRDGALWLVHGVFHPGLTWFDGERFAFLTSREGLFADSLQFVAVDGEGRVWLQSESGEVAVYERTVLIEAARR